MATGMTTSASATAVGVMKGSAYAMNGISFSALYRRGASMAAQASSLVDWAYHILMGYGSPVSMQCSTASDAA